MVVALLIVLGLIFGSFVNAFTWRLHEGKDWLRGRSECPRCHHKLAARDMVPVVSWLMLKGKCRYCGQPISWQYPAVELLTAGLFVLSYYGWPHGFQGINLFQFIVWLVILVGFVALVIYDFRWLLLPNKIILPLAILALVQAIVMMVVKWPDTTVWAPFIGGAIFAGLFYAIFRVSDGKWLGGGDVKLGVLLGLLVGGPLMSFLTLFLASLGGMVYALPLVLAKRANRQSHVPFGPFLILGTIVAVLFGSAIIKWYEHLYL